jgi:hypothetical protein
MKSKKRVLLDEQMCMTTEYQPSCSGQLLVLKFLLCLINLRNITIVIMRYHKLILSRPAELNGLQKVESHSGSRKCPENRGFEASTCFKMWG